MSVKKTARYENDLHDNHCGADNDGYDTTQKAVHDDRQGLVNNHVTKN